MHAFCACLLIGRPRMSAVREFNFSLVRDGCASMSCVCPIPAAPRPMVRRSISVEIARIAL
jgi:hypothetical protein